jgi:hypothetical protein
MKRLSVLLLTALLFQATSAIAQQQPASGPAPDRIIKFVDVKFSDPTNWDCKRPEQFEGFPLSHTDFTCLVCTNIGAGSSDLVVTHPPDATQETVSVADGAALRICADMLAIGGSPSASPVPTATGSAPTPVTAPTAAPGGM